MLRSVICGAALLALSLSASAGSAAGGNGAGTDTVASSNSTVITSERLTFDYRNRCALFERNVKVADAAMRIYADEMLVYFDESNAAKTIVAVGNVKIVQPGKVATCGKAVYDVASGRLLLMRSPVITRGMDRIAAEAMTMWRDTDRMTAENPTVWLMPQSNAGLGSAPGGR